MVTFNSSLSIIFLLFFRHGVKSLTSTESASTCPSSETQLDESKIRIVTVDPKDSSKKIENDATQYDLKEENSILNYKFKNGAKCVEVKYDDKVVWKHDSTKTGGNPASFFFNIIKCLIVVVFKETISIYNLDGEQWKTSFNGKPEPVNLDIKSKKDTDVWSYSKSGNIGTYKAKAGKFFNAVRQSASDWWRSGCCSSNCCSSSCCSSNCCTSGCGSSCGGSSAQEIWKTEDVSEYATKVIVKGIGSSTKLVAIFLVNGDTKGFHRDGTNKEWTEKTLVERKQKSTGNSESGIELDVTIKAGGDGFTASELAGRYTYAAIGENGFSKVKHGDKEIWKAEKKEGYAKKVVYFEKETHGLPNLEIYLPNNNKLEYDKKDDKWTKRGASQQSGNDQANKTSGGGTQPTGTN